MDNLNEKKVVVKRRYTEAYPAKNISTNARVRSVILDAISDGHITEEEMSRILTTLEANKRWLSRNKTLFNISEDQEGIVTYALSPYGKRVKDRTTPKVLNEALNVPHKERGRKPVNMFVGRFQPFTLGHVKVFEKMYKENGLPVVVFLVRGKNNDSEKRPFDEAMQQAMFTKMAKQYPFLETAIVVPNGAIDTMFAAARPAYEPMMWGYGTDRKKSYGAMINKQRYRDELGVDPEFKGFEIFRTDDNISASKVRNALKVDDEKTFKKMTPRSIHKFYKTLQDIIQPLKENKNMKNLKSLSDFSNINEAKFNKKSLMKKMKKDDGMIQLGNGEEYIIYAFGNGNDDNDSMWGDKTIFGLDQDGGEHEIKYSDIVSYNESNINEESFADFNKSSGFRMDSKAKSTLKKLKVDPTKLNDAFDDYDKIMDYLDDNGKKIGTVSIPNPGSKSDPEFMYTVYDTDKYGKVLTGDGDSVFIEINEGKINEGMYTANQLSNMLLDDIRDGKRKGVETPTADEIQKLAPRIGKKKIQKRDIQDVIDDWGFMVNQAKGETMRNKMFGVTAKVFESKINEEYIELMRGLEEGLEEIVEGWIEWKSGPATERGDIAPARKELLNFCTAYLKKNIK